MGRKRLRVSVALPAALLAVALLVGGCGSDSKPDYCSNVSDLQGSVDELSSVKLESGVLGTVEADLKKIQADANAVVSSAKQDFPNETSALESSVSKLSTTVNQLPPAPTPQQLVGLGAQIQSTVTAAQELSSATESACE